MSRFVHRLLVAGIALLCLAVFQVPVSAATATLYFTAVKTRINNQYDVDIHTISADLVWDFSQHPNAQGRLTEGYHGGTTTSLVNMSTGSPACIGPANPFGTTHYLTGYYLGEAVVYEGNTIHSQDIKNLSCPR
jgi:hypothetical protein